LRLFDYYRQFQGMSEEEIGEELRRRADERRHKALERVEPLDLSSTTWHEFPHPDVVAAVTYTIRRGINRYADPSAEALRRELGRRFGLEPGRVVVGNGAGQLLSAAAEALLEPGDELVTPWPSYPLYPLMARRAGAQAVPVPGGDPDALLGAISGQTRMVVVCNPNDPTGAYHTVAELEEVLSRLPERVVLVLDEALVDFVETEPPGASLSLLDDHPRLIVVRTFSKIYGLAGLRCGYALGGPGAEPLLECLEPPLGVGALVQAGALEALHKQGPQVVARRATVLAERARLLDALADTTVDASPTEANVVWMTAPGLEGAELAHRLEARGVMVRSGASFGATDHVRATVRSAEATDRLLRALETSVVDRPRR